jgi:2-alkyl-3-oxoalkanoate reductase
MRVMVAGAGGAIGRSLVPQLLARGHQVVGTTRTSAKCDALRALGAEPLVMDGLDAASVGDAVARAHPEVIVHEMTSLAGIGDLKHFDDTFAVTNALRATGTEHLLAAARAVGVRRLVAQGYAGWPSAPVGGPVKTEDDPLDPDPPAEQRRSLAALRGMEQMVSTAPLQGLVLRYGSFYGPGASDELVKMVHRRRLPVVGEGTGVWSWVHIDDVAAATAFAVEQGEPGVYNIVDDEPAPVSAWLTHLAACLQAPPPRHVPVWLARFVVGDVGVSMMTRVRGASNAKARRELGWTPRWSSWREGFRAGLQATAASPAPLG